MANIYDGTFILGNTSATTLSAGEGIKLDTSIPGTIGISNDETVLWSDTANGLTSGSLVLNEPWSGFEKVRLHVVDQFGWGGSCMDFDTTNLAGTRTKYFACPYSFVVTGSPNRTYIRGIILSFNNDEYISGSSVGMESIFAPPSTVESKVVAGGAKLIKVIGVNRIAGGN